MRFLGQTLVAMVVIDLNQTGKIASSCPGVAEGPLPLAAADAPVVSRCGHLRRGKRQRRRGLRRETRGLPETTPPPGAQGPRHRGAGEGVQLLVGHLEPRMGAPVRPQHRLRTPLRGSRQGSRTQAPPDARRGKLPRNHPHPRGVGWNFGCLKISQESVGGSVQLGSI